jgi:hypothetical protein
LLTAVAVLAQPEFAIRSDEIRSSEAPEALFGAGSLLLVELWLLLDRLCFPQRRLNALGQILAGRPLDARDINIHFAVRADGELDFLHDQYFLRVITVSWVAASNLSL